MATVAENTTPEVAEEAKVDKGRRMKVEAVFLTESLGTIPAIEEIYQRHILAKAPDPVAAAGELDEVPDVGEAADEATTYWRRGANGLTRVRMRRQLTNSSRRLRTSSVTRRLGGRRSRKRKKPPMRSS